MYSKNVQRPVMINCMLLPTFYDDQNWLHLGVFVTDLYDVHSAQKFNPTYGT